MSNIQTQLKNLPEHDEERFESFSECQVNGKDGFKLEDGSTFIFEANKGWVDENGCRYDADGAADGWYIKDDKGREHLYDLTMRYVPTDEEDLEELPKHLEVDWQFKGKYVLYKDKKFLIDGHGGWEDDEGCYYDQDGKAAGWIIKKADGKLYLFDMKGAYVDREDDEDNDLLHYCNQNQSHHKQRLAHPVKADKRINFNNSSGPQKQQQQQQSYNKQQQQQPKTGGTYIYAFQLTNSEKDKFKEDTEILRSFLREKIGKEYVEFLLNFKGDELTVKTKVPIESISELKTFSYSEGKSAKKTKEEIKK